VAHQQFRLKSAGRAVVLLIALLTGARQLEASDAYVVPLAGDIAVRRDDAGHLRSDRGVCTVVRVLGPTSWGDIIPDVKQVGVVKGLIVGESKKGFFLFDPTIEPDDVQFFPTVASWSSALGARGVSPAPVLSTPDVLASKLPDQTTRPWNYRVMRNALRLSDDAWAAMVQLLGLLVALIMGYRSRKSSLVAIGIAIGLPVDFIAQMVIAGGGPGAFAGLLALPLMYGLTAGVGRLLDRFINRESSAAPS
jgi:hypothetical protein